MPVGLSTVPAELIRSFGWLGIGNSSSWLARVAPTVCMDLLSRGELVHSAVACAAGGKERY